MDMVLNSLPGKTWYRLHLNDKRIAVEVDLESLLPAACGDTSVYEENSTRCYPDMKTGSGPDVRTLTEGAALCAVHTAEHTRMDAPVVLTYTSHDGKKEKSRLILHAEKGSTLRAVVLQTAEEGDGLTVLQTEILCEEDAKVELFMAQVLPAGFVLINDIGGTAAENASVVLRKLELGAGRVYSGVNIDLKGRESSFTTETGYHVIKDQMLDMNYVAEHHGARTNSLMEVTGTLEDGAKKTFRGTIDFPRGCPGSKGTETENVLLLGDDLVNQSIPLILCKEEDVEGNHGASIGRLDDKMLFYLSTRGICEEAAQQIIAQARIESLCEKIPDESVQEAVRLFEEQRRKNG